MAKKTAKEMKEKRTVVDTAWRNAHNLVAGMNEIVEARDVLAIAKEAYDDQAALEDILAAQRVESEGLASAIRAAQTELAGVKEHVAAATDAEHRRALGELETKKKTLTNQIAKLEEKSTGAQKAHDELMATLKVAEDAARARVTKFEADAEAARKEYARVSGQLRQLQSSIPTGGA